MCSDTGRCEIGRKLAAEKNALRERWWEVSATRYPSPEAVRTAQDAYLAAYSALKAHEQGEA